MTKLFLSFEAENEDELLRLVLGYAMRQKQPPSWLDKTPPPSSPELQEDAATLSDEEYDAKHDPKSNGAAKPEPTPEPAPEPAKRARAPRAPRVSVVPPEPEPTPAPADLPPLDTLKAVVTNAVRLAQKGEGSKKILDLLPAFKDTTGLAFVMNAEDKHRAALYDLVQAATLPVV